ncbi:PLSCR2, partial [Symbiodinium sp. KB8]
AMGTSPVDANLPGMPGSTHDRKPDPGAAFSLLHQHIKGVAIKQRIELGELFLGCETANKYDCFMWDPSVGVDDWKKGFKPDSQLYSLRERGDGCKAFCNRQCCGSMRGFVMDMVPNGAYVPNAASHDEMIVMERPFKCECACFCRPRINVMHPALGDLCEVYFPCPVDCCINWTFYVRQPTKEGATKLAKDLPDDWYIIKGYKCQPGALCTCPTGPCKNVQLRIYDAADTECTTQIGTIAKVFSGCLKEAFTDADSFVVEFPEGANPMQKAALVACTVLLDFLLFENNERHGE